MSTTFGRDVHRPDHAAYDGGRAALRADIDAHPSLIVRAAGVADVRSAVVLARANDLPFAVQATGHGTHTAADGAGPSGWPPERDS